jgi:hypothetical protein
VNLGGGDERRSSFFTNGFDIQMSGLFGEVTGSSRNLPRFYTRVHRSRRSFEPAFPSID